MDARHGKGTDNQIRIWSSIATYFVSIQTAVMCMFCREKAVDLVNKSYFKSTEGLSHLASNKLPGALPVEGRFVWCPWAFVWVGAHAVCSPLTTPAA